MSDESKAAERVGEILACAITQHVDMKLLPDVTQALNWEKVREFTERYCKICRHTQAEHTADRCVCGWCSGFKSVLA